MQDLKMTDLGISKLTWFVSYAFCVVCNFFHIVITDASALISGCNEADITRIADIAAALTVSAAVAAAGGSTTAGWSLLSPSSSLSASAAA